MQPITISLVTLGTIKHSVDFGFLEAWKSKIIKIDHRSSLAHLPNAIGADWDYTDSQLRSVLKPDVASDLTVGLIDAPIEDNYYMRRLTERSAVLSLHEMADILQNAQFPIEQFILRNCYEMAVILAGRKNLLPADYSELAHDDIRGCLLDMNSNKTDIVFSLHKPTLCTPCASVISAEQLPNRFLSTLLKELKRIRKPLYARATAWVKQHPLLALVITSCFAILLNLIASFAFDSLNSIFRPGSR